VNLELDGKAPAIMMVSAFIEKLTAAMRSERFGDPRLVADGRHESIGS
jgi:hypothetical protein